MFLQQTGLESRNSLQLGTFSFIDLKVLSRVQEAYDLSSSYCCNAKGDFLNGIQHTCVYTLISQKQFNF